VDVDEIAANSASVEAQLDIGKEQIAVLYTSLFFSGLYPLI
jgi:hypothetical protein